MNTSVASQKMESKLHRKVFEKGLKMKESIRVTFCEYM